MYNTILLGIEGFVDFPDHMGDLQDFSRQPYGVVMEDCPSNPDLASIEEGGWGIAEETTQQVVCCIHPTLDSEEKRKDVIEYVQKLIRFSLGCEVNSMALS